MMNTEILYKTYKTPLFSLAYRMLGSVMDAEDIVQEAFLSYNQLPDNKSITNERAYLYKMVTNRCLDLLRSSMKKREMYIGPWLPEPLMEKELQEADPSDVYLRHESISTAYLLLLQQLNAVERAVFLLREIFCYSYGEIADMVGKSDSNCRQIYHRAQKAMHLDPDQQPSISVAEEQIKAFASSILQGNTKRLLELVNEDIILYSDGGGKVRAAQIPVAGFEQVMRMLQNLLKMNEGKFAFDFLLVNGAPGIHIRMEDGQQYVYSFAFQGDQIRHIYVVANPEKLRHV